MRSWLPFILPISSVPLLATALLLPSNGQTRQKTTPKPHVSAPAQAAPDTAAFDKSAFDKTTTAFFTQSCASCHNAKAKAGGLDLQSLSHAGSFRASLTRSRETWESIVRKVRTGEMPPPGSPKPSGAQVKDVTQRIEAELERADRLAASNPGRVTARRLNRAEYNNTVHDLLGVNIRPADDFPQDDSGYGFDNNGDVLSLAPAQMDRYLASAEKLARTAIYGPEILKPTLARHDASGRNIVPAFKVPASYDASGLTVPNSFHVTHRFPADGEYLFRTRLDGLRPLGSEALHFGIWIDGKQMEEQAFDPTGDAAFNPDRQDFSGRTVECRLRVTGGEHWIAATVGRMYEGLPKEVGGPNPSQKTVAPPVFKPFPGLPPERIAEFRKRFEARQKEKVVVNDARVSGLEIGGPYNQAKGPSETSLRKVFTCGHLHGGHNAACAHKIISDFASRAFRRPVTEREINRFTNLVTLARKQGNSFEEGICLALEGILVSPHFLYRIEQDPTVTQARPVTSGDTSHLITQHELASRLSYFLWSSMPDEQLRACADKQTLRSPGVLAAQVRRMLKNPRSSALSQNFSGQWLQFRALESVKPDRQRFPDFDEYLRMSMRHETEMFFDNLMREDRSILDLLVGKYTFLNGRLANFYGIGGVEGPEFRKVDLTGTPRGGILTQASVLTVTSYANRTSPVLRGKWILENILNSAPPPPPPGVPNLDVSTVGSEASLRQQLEAHRKNPTCAACHARMDPLGFGLENFDAVGAWRTNDGKIPIDASGSLPDGRNFNGPDGMKGILKADQTVFAQCLTAKLLTYALGRGLERYDNATVKAITQHIALSDYRFSNLVLEIVASKPFQMRKGDKAK